MGLEVPLVRLYADIRSTGSVFLSSSITSMFRASTSARSTHQGAQHHPREHHVPHPFLPPNALLRARESSGTGVRRAPGRHSSDYPPNRPLRGTFSSPLPLRPHREGAIFLDAIQGGGGTVTRESLARGDFGPRAKRRLVRRSRRIRRHRAARGVRLVPSPFDREVLMGPKPGVAKTGALLGCWVVWLAFAPPAIEAQNCYICSGDPGVQVCLNNFSFTGWTQCTGHAGLCWVYGEYVENCQWEELAFRVTIEGPRPWLSESRFPAMSTSAQGEPLELPYWPISHQRTATAPPVRLQRRTCDDAVRVVRTGRTSLTRVSDDRVLLAPAGHGTSSTHPHTDPGVGLRSD